MDTRHPGFFVKVERLRQRRTQRSLAAEVGIAPGVLSDYENGYRDLPPDVLARLHRALAPRAEGRHAGAHP